MIDHQHPQLKGENNIQIDNAVYIKFIIQYWSVFQDIVRNIILWTLFWYCYIPSRYHQGEPLHWA